ncbi:MAG: hypothetical protein QF479_01630 [Candidatus Poseidoniaceae archaeon]|jgi:hypothetical protein|nr:hypothetical protein [Candidatus Poseidoniaceae archaeon]
MKNDKLVFLWSQLSEFVKIECDGLTIVFDEPGDLRIETSEGRPFVTIRIQRRHVGMYLLPLYYHRHLITQYIENLRKGKTTLYFKTKTDIDEIEIRNLIQNCRTMIGKY